MIKDAIRDNNVLGFNVQYIGTIKGKKITDDEQVSGIDTQEAFENEKRMRLIATHILLNHDQVTKDRQYNAIFTVPSTKMAMKYYKIFKDLNKNNDLNITTIFTWQANEDDAEKKQKDEFKTSRHGLDSVVKDYNKQYGTNYNTDKFSQYFNDVSKRMKNHNAKTPQDNIDILIVVNMFLTGFDSKKLSTLYIDKPLRWQGLIQAFSRTNRIEKKTKPFGNIICYRNLKKETDDAVTLFSAGSKEYFYVPTYDELATDFTKNIHKLKSIAPEPRDVDPLYDQGEQEVSQFVLAYRDILRTFNKIRVYDDFKWDNFETILSEQQMQSFKSKYYAAYDWLKRGKEVNPNKVSILNDIDFDIELLETDQINVEYIVNLIKSIDLQDADARKSDTKKIKRILVNPDSEKLKSKADLLMDFLDQVVPKLNSNANVGNELNEYLAKRKANEILEFSKENKIPQEIIDKQLSDYDFYGKTNSEEVLDALNKAGYDFKQKITIKNRIKKFVVKTMKRFAMS